MWVWIAAIALTVIVLLRRNREGVVSGVGISVGYMENLLARLNVSAMYSNWTKLSGKVYMGGVSPKNPVKYTAANVNECISKCDAEVDCRGINYTNTSPAGCIKFTSLTNLVPIPSYISYAKPPDVIASRAAAATAAADKAAADKAAADKAAAAVAAKYTMKPNQQLTKAMMLGMGGATSDVTQALTECDSNSRCMGIGYQTYGPYKQSYMYSDISNPETTPSNLINTYINQPRVDQAAADKAAADKAAADKAAADKAAADKAAADKAAADKAAADKAAADKAAADKAAARDMAYKRSDQYKDWKEEVKTFYEGNMSTTNQPTYYMPVTDVDSCITKCSTDPSGDCLGVAFAYNGQTPQCVKYTSLTNPKQTIDYEIVNSYQNPKPAADKAAAEKAAADKAAADKAAADKAAAELTASSTVSSKYSDWTMQADTYYYMDTYLKGDAATLDECIASCDTSTDPCLGIGYTSGSQGNCLRYMTLKSNPRTYVGLNFYKNPKSAIPLNTSIDSPPMPSGSMDPNSNPMMYYPNLTAAI